MGWYSRGIISGEVFSFFQHHHQLSISFTPSFFFFISHCLASKVGLNQVAILCFHCRCRFFLHFKHSLWEAQNICITHWRWEDICQRLLLLTSLSPSQEEVGHHHHREVVCFSSFCPVLGRLSIISSRALLLEIYFSINQHLYSTCQSVKEALDANLGNNEYYCYYSINLPPTVSK